MEKRKRESGVSGVRQEHSMEVGQQLAAVGCVVEVGLLQRKRRPKVTEKTCLGCG